MFAPRIALILTGLFVIQGDAFGSDDDLAEQGVAFLRTYCKKCHGDALKYPGLDVTNRATLLAPKVKDEDPFLVLGDAGESRLWDAVDSEYMPPENQPLPSDDEKAQFKAWIEEGAPFPTERREQREFLGESTVLKHISDDLQSLPEKDVPYTRYFSLVHLWNDTTGSEPTTSEDLRLVRAAVSKLVNSLSNRPRIIVPRVVDQETETILAIDMRDYGWGDWHWNEILKTYPYGLKVPGEMAADIYRMTQSRIPYVRADWFVAIASRPPLYHTMLGIPQNAKTLETDLGVDIHQNFVSGQLMRAAFSQSGVSQQNRMLERHDSSRGGQYYWKSYDIKPGAGADGDFTRRPLGPIFEQTEGRQLASFVHDGGEIIYGLPNGLQAYMLVTGTDDRIDEGPPDVVFDPNSHGGSVLITNGISCMGCHRHGMIGWEADQIRPLFADRQGQVVADKVRELFPPDEEMFGWMKSDRERFLAALEKSVGVFLRTDDQEEVSIRSFPEPITQVSNRYLMDVSLETAGREMGWTDLDSLRTVTQLRTFKTLGLANWSNDGSISRENWERAYGRCCRELDLGTPIHVR